MTCPIEEDPSKQMPKTLKAAKRFSGKTARAFDLSDKAYDLEREGRDIIHLSVGDPDFDTPGVVIDTAVSSLRSGRTHYSPIPGEPALRRAIAAQASEKYGQPVTADQVVVFSGAQNALFATMICMAEVGDEVILVEPAYTTYDAIAASGGARAVRVALSAEDGFQIDARKIEKGITSKTRAILINSPGNPSGTVFRRPDLEALIALCRTKGIWLISDEVYWPYIYNGEHVSPYSLDCGPQTTFVINSLSKSHAMTGWRLGWVIAPPNLVHHLIDVAQCMLFGVSQFVQDAAVTALTAKPPELDEMKRAFRERRDSLCAGLGRVRGIKPHVPAGGMFLLADVSETGLDGYEFAERLLQDQGLSVVPGFGFGDSLSNFVRIGYLSSTEILDEAVRRIERFVGALP
ncbi:MAG: aminotransferase class I/II-fold pyridoxal phosphate-dependent enzyme [Pseudomonadota bacterium]